MRKMMLSLAALILSAGAYAHDSARVRKSPEEMANKKADKLKTELSLSDEQRSSVYGIILEKINKTRAIKIKYKDAKDKESMRAEMASVRSDFDAGMKKILSEEQYKNWQNIKEKQKKERKGKRSGKTTGSAAP